jgi:predicted ATPase
MGLQGWALVERAAQSGTWEQREAGLVQIREGLAILQAAEIEAYVPLVLGALAQGYAQGGQAQEGLRVIAEALALVKKTEERWNEAELSRLKGELVLQSGVRSPKTPIPNTQAPSPQVEAEACYLKAIAIARKQQAKSLELRAATSLARLWQRQGKRQEAHGLLLEIYNWFTEGFATKDLQEAQALLEELA